MLPKYDINMTLTMQGL